MITHPLYIASDEEIISVIARLRNLREQDVTLVFPKTSVVTQSIINLKLLAREGEKLQKNLTLVSQNENARLLAEKLGFETLPYTSDLEKESVYLDTAGTTDEPSEPVLSAREPSQVPTQSEVNDTSNKPRMTDIGSHDFYTVPPVEVGGESKTLGDIKQPISEVPKSQASEPNNVTLRIRNNSPERLPGLNSVRYEESLKESSDPAVAPTNNTFKPSLQATPALREETPEAPTAIQNFFGSANGNNKAQTSFQAPKTQSIAPSASDQEFTRKEAVIKKSPPIMVGDKTSKKLRYILWLIAFVVLLCGSALIFFLIFPKALVLIVPQTLEETTDQTFSIALAGDTSDNMKLERITREITVSIPGVASGASDATSNSSGSKAKGKIKITNSYSSEDQPLVATTRFESESGKIYRTPVAVTIPGNGSIEIEVIADGSGESYNLENGNFTIPGFKGSDKYEKIKGASVGAITGGGGEEQVSGGTFIRADEETLRQRAADTAKQMFTEEVNNETGDTYTFTDGLVAERITEENLPKVGTTPGDYTYNAVFKITAYTIAKEDVTQTLLRNIKTEYDGIRFVPTNQKLEFTDFTVDAKGETASLKAHLDSTLKAAIDEEKVRADLAGKSAEEMSNFTDIHPEIRSLEATFEPSWALKRIPSDTRRIELLVQ